MSQSLPSKISVMLLTAADKLVYLIIHELLLGVILPQDTEELNDI